MKRLLAAAVALIALAGCAADEPTMTPATQPAVAPSVPEDGIALNMEFAPAGLSVPSGAMVVEEIDQVNNITIVFSAPTGAELAAYYRRTLPELGFTITADANNSLLFEDAQWTGGFTASGAYSALTLRTDWE
ncbi:MAG: hypothetical protein GX596_13100 [Propionibacterium sp.]|nr:hypothetical protein [Propionibacterium sp.]